MLISTKKYYFILLLLLPTNHVINTFFENTNFPDNLMKMIGKHHQELPHPNFQLLNNYLTQWRCDLNELFNDKDKKNRDEINEIENEIDEIINATKQALQAINLDNSNLVEETKRTILVEHIENKINREISRYENQQNRKLDQALRKKIETNRLNEFLKRISDLKYIKGSDIKDFFGNSRTNAIEQACRGAIAAQERLQQSSYPSAPPAPVPAAPQSTPSVPPAPLHNAYKAQKDAEEFDEAIKKMKKNNQSDYLFKKDVDDLKIIILSNSSEDDSLENTKISLQQLLNQKLATEEEALKTDGFYFLNDIENAINKTRIQKIRDIKRLKEIDGDIIAQIIGNRSTGESNVKSAVHDNLRKNRR